MRTRSAHPRSGLRRLLPALLVSVLVAVGAVTASPALAAPSSAASPVAPTAAKDSRVGDFTYALNASDGTATLTGWSGKRKKTISIPAKITVSGTSYRVTRIGYGAFAGPVTYVLPDYSPTPATKATIPSGIESIDDFAFYGNAITSFTIPATVTWIGTSALDQDRITGTGWKHPLRKVTFRGDAPQMSELGSYICSPGGCGYNGQAPFGIGNGFIVYFAKGAKGFTAPIWAGYLSAVAGTAPVPKGFGSKVADYLVAVDKQVVPGAKLTARLHRWAVGAAFSPKPTSITYRWQLRASDGTWTTLGNGKTMTIPRDAAGKTLRILTIAKRGSTHKSVLQFGTYAVLTRFTTTPTPRITAPAGTTRIKVGTKLTATGATAGSWSPKPDAVSYQWYRNGKAITSRGTSRTYVVVAADKGKKLTVRATATKQDYAITSRTSAARSVPKS